MRAKVNYRAHFACADFWAALARDERPLARAPVFAMFLADIAEADLYEILESHPDAEISRLLAMRDAANGNEANP